MATTSFLSYNITTTLHHFRTSKISQVHAFDPLISHISIQKDYEKFSFLNNGSFQSFKKFPRPTSEQKLKRDLVVYATPEAAAEGLLSFLPADTPWFAWIGCAMVAIPLLIQRAITFTNQVEAVAETVEGIADTVGNVADEIDKAADEMLEKLPDGTFKNIVQKVEDLAEATSKEAHKVEELMDKVEDMSNQVEDFIIETTKKDQSKVTSDRK